MKKKFLPFFLTLLSLALTSIPLLANDQDLEVREIATIHRVFIQSTINPATYNYLEKVVSQIKEEEMKSSLVLIEMDTPGGLVTTTKDILTLFGKSNFPFVVWVHPEGGSATSAGALIASGAHLIYMSEGTNIGAATPIEMGGNIGGEKGTSHNENKSDDSKSDLRAKAINDLVALVKSLSDVRDRNGDKFSEMITKASSFTAKEALQEMLINGVANSSSELLKKMNQKKVKIQGIPTLLNVSTHVEIKDHPMDLGQKLLNIFAHPSMAYILFLIGAALLYLELQAPGGYIAGSIGAMCLVLSGIGLQVLPLNFGALGLIILSFILFILEIFVTSFGLLSIAAFASLIFGSLFLYRTDDSYITFSTSFVAATVLAIGSFLGLCLYFILRDHKNIGKEKFNSAEGKQGIIIKVIDESHEMYIYQIKVGGEFWRAQSKEPLELNAKVRVVNNPLQTDHQKNEMILNIERI